MSSTSGTPAPPSQSVPGTNRPPAHAREGVVTKAGRDLSDFLLKLADTHSLTLGEVSYLLSLEQIVVASDLVSIEREGDDLPAEERTP